MYRVLFALTWGSMPSAARSRLCSMVSAWAGVFARSAMSSALTASVIGPLHVDEQRQDDQQEPIYNSSVPIQDIAWKTFRKQCTIETSGEKGSEISMLAA